MNQVSFYDFEMVKFDVKYGGLNPFMNQVSFYFRDAYMNADEAIWS